MAWSFSLRGSSFALRPSEAGDTGVKFSFAEDNFLFKKALKDYIHGQWDMSRSLPVTARTPILYQRLDLADKGFRVKNYPITIPPHVIKKATGELASTSTGEAHHISIEELEKLPDSIYHPVMILDSNTENSLEVITMMFDENKKPVLTAIRLDVKEGHHHVHSIRSAYGKDNVNSLINKLKSGHGRYVNTKLAANWSLSVGGQFPGEVLLKSRCPHIIIENPDNSSAENQKNVNFPGNDGVDSTAKRCSTGKIVLAQCLEKRFGRGFELSSRMGKTDFLKNRKKSV